MTGRKLSHDEIVALPDRDRFAAILEHFTEDERAVLAAVADQINAMPTERQLALAKAIAKFAKNRVSN